jgi:proline iminopeptidase
VYPEVEAFDGGFLDVGDGNRVFWEVLGNPSGKPAVVLHGGPGSGCAPWWGRLFDPEAYRVVLFDQRGCGRSLPSAADPTTDLTTNTTGRLISDIEALRHHLGVDRWLVLGGSWGSTLGLAYAQAHPDRVSEIVLFSVVTTTKREVEWVTREMGRLFPVEWARFREGVPDTERDGSLVDAYARMLNSPNHAVRKQAARDWCDWEEAHVGVYAGQRRDPRYEDADFRMGFARLVTHYWSHAAWLEDDQLLRGLQHIQDIRGVLIHGRLDVSSPLDVPWMLARSWAGSELLVVDDAGHGSGRGMDQAIVAATDRLARPREL